MHGANDAQKTMGIIAGALVTGGYLQAAERPAADPVLGDPRGAPAIGLGTLSGGWRIIHTMGSKITKLHPEGGFAAETGAAVAIYTATAARRRHQHDAHHHRRHCRRRRDATAVGRPMGCRAADRMGMGADDPSRGAIGAVTYWFIRTALP